MKKIAIALFVGMVLTSCVEKEPETNTVTISKTEYEGLKTQDRDYPKPFSMTEKANNGDCIVLGSDGHDYILTRIYVSSLVHSPECPKCKEKEMQLNNLIYQLLNKKDSIK